MTAARNWAWILGLSACLSPLPLRATTLQAPGPSSQGSVIRPAHLAARMTPEWQQALETLLLSDALHPTWLSVRLPSYEGDPRALLGPAGTLGPLVAQLERRGITPGTLGEDPKAVMEAFWPAASGVQDLARALADRAFSDDADRALDTAHDLEEVLVRFRPYFKRDELAELHLAAAAARVKAGASPLGSSSYRQAETWRQASRSQDPQGRRRAPDPLVFAARSFAQGLAAAGDEILLARSKGLDSRDPGAAFARAVEERRQMVLQVKGADAASVDWLAYEVLGTLGRWARARGEEDMRLAADEVIGRLTRMTHKRWFVLRPFKDAAQFQERLARSFDSIALWGPTGKANAVAGIGSYGILGGFLYSLAHAAFPPLPAQLDMARLLSLDIQAGPLFAWTFITLGFIYLSALAGETFDHRFRPLDYVSQRRFLGYLPLGMVLEEGIFRLGLLIGPAWLLGWLGWPLFPAILLCAAASSALFARVHTYGPKLPRFVAGLSFGYVALTYGLPMAVLVHLLLDLILILGSYLWQALSVKTTVPARPT